MDGGTVKNSGGAQGGAGDQKATAAGPPTPVHLKISRGNHMLMEAKHVLAKQPTCGVKLSGGERGNCSYPTVCVDLDARAGTCGVHKYMLSSPNAFRVTDMEAEQKALKEGVGEAVEAGAVYPGGTEEDKATLAGLLRAKESPLNPASTTSGVDKAIATNKDAAAGRAHLGRDSGMPARFRDEQVASVGGRSASRSLTVELDQEEKKGGTETGDGGKTPAGAVRSQGGGGIGEAEGGAADGQSAPTLDGQPLFKQGERASIDAQLKAEEEARFETEQAGREAQQREAGFVTRQREREDFIRREKDEYMRFRRAEIQAQIYAEAEARTRAELATTGHTFHGTKRGGAQAWGEGGSATIRWGLLT